MKNSTAKRSAETTLKIGVFRRFSTFKPKIRLLVVILVGRGSGRPPPRGCGYRMEPKWGLGLDVPSHAGLRQGKIEKNRKKNSVFRVHAVIKFRFPPMSIQFWKALGRPRKTMNGFGGLRPTVDPVWGPQKSILAIFCPPHCRKSHF